MPDREDIDPRILALCDRITAKRARTAIDHIIRHGSVTTEELQDLYGYDHPPRAIRDVRESGVPIETYKVLSKKTGRNIAAYRFDSPDKIVRGRIGGRKVFRKKFRKEIIEHYDSRDVITGERYEPRYLQIDHRIPYEVAGESVDNAGQIDAYMPLTASSQRAKSWSCEQCRNWQEGRDKTVCKSCFWASPEHYTHIAEEPIRRVYIEWRGAEVADFERIRNRALREDTNVAAFIKELLARTSS